VIATDPKMYDAYLGLGIFHFIFGSVPKAGQFLAGIGGIKGDAQLGLREIEAAARRGGYFRNDAQLILALLNIYYKNSVDQGLASLDALAKRYPKNVAILYALGSVYLDQKQPDRAVSYFDRVAQQGNNDFRTFTNMSYGRAGTAFFMKNDFARSKTYLQKFLRYSDEKMLRAVAWFMLGECYEMEGNRDFAVKAYQRALKSPQYSSPEDRYAYRKAKEFVARPMTAADIEILRALNFNASGNRDQAIALSRSALARSGTTSAQRAQGYYALGEALQAKEDYRGAIDAFNSAAHTGKHEEDWVAPYSYFHMAESYLKLGDKEKWRENLNRAQDFHGYDNEPQLRFKINRDVTLID
jgi:tetratricopeptide (TPR) repeat protein